MAASLDGRRFRPAGDVAGGEVGGDTVFVYHEEGDLIWARYSGGPVRLGYLVGVRNGDVLDFRYSQVNTAGETSNGVCTSAIEELPDGRLRLHEQWRWESRDGSGTSVVAEFSA